VLKILIGLAAAAATVLGCYFGAEAYFQHRIVGEIEANFAQIRAGGGQAKRGDLAFSLWHRNIAISDIAVEFTAPRPASIKIGHFSAKGLGLQGGADFTADTIDMTNVDASGPLAVPDGVTASFKLPTLQISDFRGPTQLQSQLKSSSSLDMYRFALEQLATVKARSVKASSLVTTTSGNVDDANSETEYSDVVLNDIRNGQIASISTGRLRATVTVTQKGKTERITVELANYEMQDFDATATAAVLDPARANDAQFYRVQGPAKVGPSTIQMDRVPLFRIEAMKVGEIKIQPSKFKVQDILAFKPSPVTTPDANKIRGMIDSVASLYEGMQITDTEITGLTLDVPQNGLKLAAMRFNLDRGKIGTFALEGLDGKSPDGPVQVGRFALKGFDVSGLMRQLSHLVTSTKSASPEAALGLLSALEGIEIRDMVAPHKKSGKLINIENANLNWGQFVGPVPSNTRFSFKMTGPIDSKDGEPFTVLRDVGIDYATVSADLGQTWSENERKLMLDPVTFEIGGLFAVTAKASVSNVNRGLFTTNSQQALLMATQMEIGPIEIVVRDPGAVDLAIAQYARRQQVDKDTARRVIMERIMKLDAVVPIANPTTNALTNAAMTFFEKPLRTLTLNIAPRAKLPVMQLMQLMKTDPSAAFAVFQIDAQTSP